VEAEQVIARLSLAPHPEGGWFRELYRSPAGPDGRGACTSIAYLLRAGERSHWHRIDAVEIWNFHAGAPLALQIAEGHNRQTMTLGCDFAAGAQPQATVPPGAWQAAHSLGAWSLVGCTVAPAFDFRFFELAPADWAPP
jgi:predicted cupin superfamily sugar epimerase